MDRFLQEEVEYAAMEGADRDRINSEREAKLSQGQTPTVNTQVYDPKQLKDNGYPLSEPTVMPNNHTKEGRMIYANGDPATENTVGRVTELPPAEFMLPTTRAYVKKTDELYGSLRDAQSTEDAEMGLQEAYFQYKIYEGFTDNEEEYNRIAWNTADKLERVGFSHLTASEKDEEGLDDRGMIGLQFVMGSMIMRGAKTPDEAFRNIGDTGANSEQLNAAWESAVKAAHRNEEGQVDPVAATNEQAMEDPRYRGAVETVLKMDGNLSDEEIAALTPEDILSHGKMYADMTKSNFAAMGTIIGNAATNKDLPIGDAVMYLLEVDEAMPFEGADFGRSILGLATDPTSYLGGAGLLAQMGGKLAGKSIARQALIKAGAAGKFGAAFGAGYGGLYDIGMQTIEKQGGVREEYDPAQFGKAAAVGGALGYVLGGAVSGLTDAGSAVLRRVSRETPDARIPAAEEFASAEIIEESELLLRRQVRGFMEEHELRKIADSEADQEKVVEFLNQLGELEEKRKLKVIKGGATEADPAHAAQMELVPTAKDEFGEFKNDMAQKMQANMEATQKLVDDNADKFTFEAGDFGTSKHSGKRFEILGRHWNKKHNEASYYVRGPDGEQLTMSDWGFVGAPPKLKVISNKMADLAQIAMDKDSTLAANAERMIMGEKLIKPNYKKKPEFLKGKKSELQSRLDEYKQLIEVHGSETFKGKELRFFTDMLEEELGKRK